MPKTVPSTPKPADPAPPGPVHKGPGKLFWLCQLATLFVMGLFVYDFIVKGAAPVENNAVVVYLALLAAYSADKEVGRWASKRDPRQTPAEKRGSWFVVLWVFFYFAAYLAHMSGPEWRVPEGLAKVVVSVLGVFFSTGVSKRLFSMLRPEGTPLLNVEEADTSRARSPLMLVQRDRVSDEETFKMITGHLSGRKDGLSSADIARGLNMNRRTILRHLQMLEDDGRIRAEGDKRWKKYWLA
jgi:hypothetical protein